MAQGKRSAEGDARPIGSESLKVLHVISGLSPRFGGPVTILGMCRELARQGLGVSLFTNDLVRPGTWIPRPRSASSTWVADGAASPGMELKVFQTHWPSRFGYSPALGQEIRTRVRQFDIVHIHGLYLYPSSAAAHHARGAGIPYIIEPHGSLAPVIYRHHRFLKWPFELLVERRNMTRAAALSFATDQEMTQARWLGITAPGLILPLGVDPAEFDRLPSPDLFLSRHPELRERRLLVFIGRITRKKGLDLLAAAFGLIASRFPDVQLVIAGPDDEGHGREIKRQLRKAGLAGRAAFTGMLCGDEMRSLMAATTLWVLSSYDENFGIAVVEAMAAGLPIVITDRVQIWPQLHRADAALVVPCEREPLAAALSRALSNSELRSRLGRTAKLLASEKFSLEAGARQLIQAYRDLRESHPKTVATMNASLGAS